MPPPRKTSPRDEIGGRLSIGALSRATGIPVETLRTWESRYGFPTPDRKPSGHRVYPVSSVPRLLRISEALGRGLRAGEVVSARESEIDHLLAAMPALAAARRQTPARPREAALTPSEIDDLLADISRFDGEKLTRRLLGEHARSAPVDFLENRVVPLLRAMGEAWEKGRLDIRHEHFASERIGDLLRSLRQALESRATGPVVVYATLPRESHGLGLQMAAYVLSLAGFRALYLGVEVPPSEIVSIAPEIDARVVAISVSEATRGPRTQANLRKLREALPRRIALVAGGEGARPTAGVEVIQRLEALADWGAKLAVML